MVTLLNKPTIADRLRSLLQSRDLNVSELARQIKLPQPTVQRIASGTHHRPHAKTLHAIAHYFGITESQLRGLDPIPWLRSQRQVRYIPILEPQEVLHWPTSPKRTTATTVTDLNTSEHTFALAMPDGSMEPLIPKGALLIIDPDRTPGYRSMVVVKTNKNDELFIRQLIIDSKVCYIKPLSQEFDQLNMAILEPDDSIRGVVVEVRLHCEDI